MNIKKVCVVGLGYIGLPTSALLANKGYVVHGVDIVQNVVDTINQGKIHISEPDLDTFVKAAIKSGKLKADTKPTYADVFIISVPTPLHEGYKPNVDYVINAAESIFQYLNPGNLVILESTSPVGTTEMIENLAKSKGIDTEQVFFAYCPERVLPGQIMKELVENDRIVGGTTPKATKLAAEFYRSFVSGQVFETNAKTAELTKLAENAFRDVNIAFANELSMICDNLGIDVWELIRLANRHPRVKILNPGCGVGGHCIAIDPWFIVYTNKELAKLIKTAREVNLYKTEWVLAKIKAKIKDFESTHNRKPILACMGLAFKPDTDDLRESPALHIAKTLKSENYEILAVEPNISYHSEFKLYDIESAIKKADIAIFLVAHKAFKKIQQQPNFLDFCGVFTNL